MSRLRKEQRFRQIVRIVKDLNPDKRLKSKDKALLIRFIELGAA